MAINYLLKEEPDAFKEQPSVEQVNALMKLTEQRVETAARRSEYFVFLELAQAAPHAVCEHAFFSVPYAMGQFISLGDQYADVELDLSKYGLPLDAYRLK